MSGLGWFLAGFVAGFVVAPIATVVGLLILALRRDEEPTAHPAAHRWPPYPPSIND